MKAVGLKVLKNRLSEFVRMAAAGETILVTDRKRVVAELNPPRDGNGTVGEAFLADLVRRGIMTPARSRTGRAPPTPPPVMTFEEVMEMIDRDRSDD